MKEIWGEDGVIKPDNVWIKNVVKAYRKDEVDARIQELKEENERISKLYEESQRGWKKALLEIEALKKGGTA